VIGKLFGKRPSENPPASPLVSEAAARALHKADDLGHLSPECEMARYETLGQTLVTTIIAQSLSGMEAERLVEDLAARFNGEIAPVSGVGGAVTRPRHLVLDLQNVEYMDSGAIGSLVSLLTQLHKIGGRIALVNTQRNVQFLFKLTRLDRLFPICTDVMRAIEVVERGSTTSR
jgi:ABC-type transporter Mla MlaB component